tara:strand:+ start:271 stop:1944 length:1674 start_codon:yes stop_codon:yes gene_type:complete
MSLTKNPLFANIGNTLLRKNSEQVNTASVLKDKVVGLYFSAHWCQPCRQFTPLLAEKYKQLQKNGVPFEIVFVSKDDQSTFMNYYQSMPNWLAVPNLFDNTGKTITTTPMGAPVAITRLSHEYDVYSLPTLVLFDTKGNMITDKGYERILDESIPFPYYTASKKTPKSSEQIKKERIELGKAKMQRTKNKKSSKNKQPSSKSPPSIPSLTEMLSKVSQVFCIYPDGDIWGSVDDIIWMIEIFSPELNKMVGFYFGEEEEAYTSNNQEHVENGEYVKFEASASVHEKKEKIKQVVQKQKQAIQKQRQAQSFTAMLLKTSQVYYCYQIDEISAHIEIFSPERNKMICFEIGNEESSSSSSGSEPSDDGEYIYFEVNDTIQEKKEKIKQVIQTLSEDGPTEFTAGQWRLHKTVSSTIESTKFTAEQWTNKEIIEREASRKLLEKSKIVAMSLVEGDMDQYITRQRDDSVHGQCFGKEWEIANTVNWDKFNKVVPTQYNSNIIACDIIIGQAQIYDKKLWLRYTDENHSQIKRWLDDNSDEIIRTSQFFLTSYPELAECRH